MKASAINHISYWVFDSTLNPTRGYLERYQSVLAQALGFLHTKHSFGHLHVHRLPYERIETLEALRDYEELCLAAGFEGVIVRLPNSPYKYGRSTIRQMYLGKLKRFLDAEARIVDFEEQLENTNEPTKDAKGETQRSQARSGLKGKNTLGVLVCDHPRFGLIRIGTGKGLDQKLRQEIWDNPENYRGRLAKFKYFPIGMQDKTPRFPIFLGFRDPDDL
jgi:DNA ligase-1